MMRRLDVRGNTINIIQNVEHFSRLLTWLVSCVTADNGLSRSIMVLNRVSKDRKNQIPQIESKNPVYISIQRPKR